MKKKKRGYKEMRRDWEWGGIWVKWRKKENMEDYGNIQVGEEKREVIMKWGKIGNEEGNG